MIVINDANYGMFVHDPVVAGDRKARGLVPRDYQSYPQGCYAWAGKPTFDLIPRKDMPDLIKAQEADQSSLQHLRMKAGPRGTMIPSRDQNGKGYCLPAGSIVTMEDGSSRRIEEVRLGDRVRTHLGNRRKVVQTFQRLYTGDMIGLSISGLEQPLVVTGDHRVAMAGMPGSKDGLRWFSARDFAVGDGVFWADGLAPVQHIKTRQVQDLPVFDIGVEEDHSFYAQGVVVHNCWAHSGTSAHLMVRAFMGEPYADLSAYAVACIIKSYRDEGGWGAQGVDWQVQNGIPTSKTWPQQSMSRSNDNAAMRADAAQHKIVAQWADLDSAQYDRDLTVDQMATLLLCNVPVVVDYSWWSHSVCAVRLLSIDPLKIVIWNSWGDSWSDQGMGILEGNRAVPDGAVAPLVVTPSAA